MEQRITIRIAEREYVLRAATPESEELIRLAAAAINRKISAYTAKFPGKNMVDILSFVALNESIGSITLQRKVDSMQQETASLAQELDTYLDNMEKK